MWWKLVIDLFAPSNAPESIGRPVEQLVEQRTSGTLRVECAVPPRTSGA